MIFNIFTFAFFLVLSPHFSFAFEQQMNGIKLDSYGDFSKNWKLVTVRYRKDSGEMRFTYANDTAWKALEKKTLPFPDGSVFAKIGYKTGVDPAFNSSVVPAGARRFQFMVKNSKKYPDTNGWGYALFQSDGTLFPGEEKSATLACHACHQIVPERDFVFSERIEFSPFAKYDEKSYELVKNEKHLQFEAVSLAQLIGASVSFLKKQNLKRITILSGPMRENFFGGTLDELTPVLIHKAEQIELALKQRVAVGFISKDGDTFKILKLQPQGHCSEDELSVQIWERRADWPDSLKEARVKSICYPKSK